MNVASFSLSGYRPWVIYIQLALPNGTILAKIFYSLAYILMTLRPLQEGKL